jgi:superfamily II DNA or RNA helicase
MNKEEGLSKFKVSYEATGASKKSDELGMREMQSRAFQKRGEQYLLIKSPPASGKSRALMFLALDKTKNQGIEQAIIVVPEKTIGKSFENTKLSDYGFWADWEVEPRWNLCNSPGEDGGTTKSVEAFLASDDKNLVCTHATFRLAVAQFGIEVFDNRLIAVDEFHHVSANPDNVLGNQLTEFIERDKIHLIAMTGSYFRGDADAVLSPDDESKFQTVTYTYYEQLNGYEYLKELYLSYYFYNGSYTEDILKVLVPMEKTILHIPHPASKESTKDKIKEVEHILDALGTWEGTEEETGFQLVKLSNGKTLRIADLVDDAPGKQARVQTALRSPLMEKDRDYVDIIIALGMAKEGFDWIWCEHALTVGYRASLTEIVQIIGRATRDAPGKEKTRFTNLIAELDASEGAVTDAVNDTIKAIAASLLMEQVLAPRFDFKPKTATSGPTPGFDYGENGYQPGQNNVGFNPATGETQVEIRGLAEPKSEEAKRICKEDINELIATFTQNKPTIERGLFDQELVPQELTQLDMSRIIETQYPTLDEHDQEALRQRAVAAMNITQQGSLQSGKNDRREMGTNDDDAAPNTALIDGVRQFVTDVRDLDVDFIDSRNPFGTAYSLLSESINRDSLSKLQNIIAGRKVKLTLEEARKYAMRALKFKEKNNRPPSLNASDPWEVRLAEGMFAFQQMRQRARDNE